MTTKKKKKAKTKADLVDDLEECRVEAEKQDDEIKGLRLELSQTKSELNTATTEIDELLCKECERCEAADYQLKQIARWALEAGAEPLDVFSKLTSETYAVIHEESSRKAAWLA